MRKATMSESVGSDCWKVRVVLPGVVLHFLSRTRPHLAPVWRETGPMWDLVENTIHGDSIGMLDWSAVVAITWRKDGAE